MHIDTLQKPLAFLAGISDQQATLIKNELNIATLSDLLSWFPYRYSDRSGFYKIGHLRASQMEVQLLGRLVSVRNVKQKRGSRLVADLRDETGQIELIWFKGHQWILELLHIGQKYVVFGKLTNYAGRWSMAHPEITTLEQYENTRFKQGLHPVYSTTEKLIKRNLNSRFLQRNILRILEDFKSGIQEVLPKSILQQEQLIGREEAFLKIHFPKDDHELQAAQRRLKFEELFFIQLQLLQNKAQRQQRIQGHAFESIGAYFNDYYHRRLPFELTDAQKRVLKEIRADLKKEVQMNRLLQGDVGSGKTIVALLTILMALDNGFQAALVAPTEILASQHFDTLQADLQPLGIEVALLMGSTKTRERKEILEKLSEGTLSVLIGTHALFENTVVFKKIGLVVIDEQHRFGVAQRSKMWFKNQVPPHILVMTATPIPRTLAMTLYGDLDVSVIDQLPKGRKPIKTYHRNDGHRLSVFGFLKREIQKGRQVYIVYPLIQESQSMNYKDLMDGYESLSRAFPLPDYQISIVHGQMKPADKAFEMNRFVKGTTQIMVATTVIEVGVNIPNASVMVIESAERFGLAQLHQLRGRVGRGAAQSYCILMTGHALSEDGKIRMNTMVRSSDGFEIAAVDLKLRGPGNLMGTQQSGTLPLKIADLAKDSLILERARAAAYQVLEKDSSLSLQAHEAMVRQYDSLMKHQKLWQYIS